MGIQTGKKCIRLILIGAMLLSLCFSIPAGSATENLLKNGSFEEPDAAGKLAAGWEQYSPKDGALAEIRSDGAADGGRYLYLDDSGDSVASNVMSEKFEITGGQTYTLSGKAKNCTGSISLHLRCFSDANAKAMDQNARVLAQSIALNNDTADWQTFGQDITIPNDAVIGYVLVFTTSKAIVKGSIDDISVSAAVSSADSTANQHKIKIACIGDSITQGVGVTQQNVDGYPAQMQVLLGDPYEVKNFGVSAFCMLKTAVRPYWNRPEYSQALQYQPDMVVIMLGTNDIKTENWVEGKPLFVQDYVEFINSFKALPSNPKIFAVLPPPIFLDENDPERPPNNLRYEALDFIKEAARQTDSYLIDVFSVMDHYPELLPDRIHPNKEGYAVIAETIMAGILNPKPVDSLKPTWNENLKAIPPFDDPELNLSREEFAMLVVNIFGLEAGSSTGSSFVDTADSVYQADIETAYQLGIIKGIDETHFNPTGDITRQEITVMLYRAWRILFPEADFTLSNPVQFADAEDIADWAMEAVNYLYDKQIMIGTALLTISPKINIPRKDAVTLMTRIVAQYAPESEKGFAF